uniref:Protein TsetseEP domain-containing protein n=1 Tax=Megaselia scalaris TaxID=36166 RepID=T1GV13_MEGSC
MIENDRLPELAIVQGSINECVKNATEDGSWMFTSVKYTLKQAREENNYIRRTTDTCVTSYPSGYKLTDCVNDRLQRGNNNVWDLLYKTDKDIQVALDQYDNIGRQAMECTFNVVENFSRDIEDVLRTLEKCKK